jgi:hypothetical protein
MEGRRDPAPAACCLAGPHIRPSAYSRRPARGGGGVERKRLWAPLRARNVRLLIGGTGLSQIGDWLYNVALIVFVFDRTGSAAWVAAHCKR